MRARRLLWIPLLAVLVALGFFLLRPKPEENQATAFQVVEATRGDLRVTVSGYGWLSPWETLEVRPEITGTLVWLAEEGQEVQEGEVVARLDPTPFARALAEAEAVALAAMLRLAITDDMPSPGGRMEARAVAMASVSCFVFVV